MKWSEDEVILPRRTHAQVSAHKLSRSTVLMPLLAPASFCYDIFASESRIMAQGGVFAAR